MQHPKALLLALLLWSGNGVAQAQPTQAPEAPIAVENSALDGQTLALLLAAELHLADGQTSHAFAFLMEAARVSKNAELYEYAAIVALRARSADAALQAVRGWQLSAPASLSAHRYELEILAMQGKFHDLMNALPKAIQNVGAKERLTLLAQLPQWFSRSPDPAASVALMKNGLTFAFAQAPLAGSAWLSLSIAQKMAGQHDAAIASAQQALLAPQPKQEAIELLLTYHAQRSEAIEKIIAPILQGPVAPHLRLLWSQALGKQQQWERAHAELDRVIAGKEQAASAWLIKSTFLIQQAQMPQAQAAAKQALQLLESTANNAPEQQLLGQTYRVLAQLAQQEKNWSSADAWLQKIPSNVGGLDVIGQRAHLLALQNRVDDAVDLLERWPTPETSELIEKRLTQSALLREHKRHQQAYALIAPLVKENPDHFELIFELSLLAERLGRDAEMEQLSRELIRIRPKDPNGYNALGYALADRNVRLQEARALIEKAIELSPDSAHIQDSMGWVEYRLGNLGAARMWLEKAYGNMADAEIAAHLGEVLWVSGERALAARYWREGLSLKADNETLQSTLRRFDFKP
jgi:tetratricopeptide (TPR) repeat protein